MQTTVKVKTLVDLACRLGMIDNTTTGRSAYAAWLRRDHDAAQRPLAAALRSQPTREAESSSTGRGAFADGSSRPAAAARTGGGLKDAAGYPDTWRPDAAASRRVGGVRTEKAARDREVAGRLAPDTPYPANWLPDPATRARVIEARGGTPRERAVHAAGDTPTYVASLRAAEDAARVESQANRPTHTDPHDLIAASSDNAARLEAERRAEEARMEREVWNRTPATSA